MFLNVLCVLIFCSLVEPPFLIWTFINQNLLVCLSACSLQLAVWTTKKTAEGLSPSASGIPASGNCAGSHVKCADYHVS